MKWSFALILHTNQTLVSLVKHARWLLVNAAFSCPERFSDTRLAGSFGRDEGYHNTHSIESILLSLE